MTNSEIIGQSCACSDTTAWLGSITRRTQAPPKRSRTDIQAKEGPKPGNILAHHPFQGRGVKAPLNPSKTHRHWLQYCALL